MSDLNILERAEQTRQYHLNELAVGKVYPDADPLVVKGEDLFQSSKVNTLHFKGLEFLDVNISTCSGSVISARLYHTVKRPGRDPIKVYSRVVYGFTLNHVMQLVNELPIKKIMGKLGHVFRSQEPGPKLKAPKLRPTKVRDAILR